MLLIKSQIIAFASYHLQLTTFVQRVGVHLIVPVSAHKVEHTIVTECAPLGIDNDLVWTRRVIVVQLYILEVLHVAGVEASPNDHTHSAFSVLVSLFEISFGQSEQIKK